MLIHRQPSLERLHATDVGPRDAPTPYIQASKETIHNSLLQCLQLTATITTRHRLGTATML